MKTYYWVSHSSARVQEIVHDRLQKHTHTPHTYTTSYTHHIQTYTDTHTYAPKQNANFLENPKRISRKCYSKLHAELAITSVQSKEEILNIDLTATKNRAILRGEKVAGRVEYTTNFSFPLIAGQ